MNHRPTRYLIPVIPSMIFMSLLFLKKILKPFLESPVQLHWLQRGLVFFADVIWLGLAANFCFFPLADQYIRPFHIPPLSAGYFIFSALIVLLAHFLISVLRRVPAPGLKSRIRYISWPLIILLLGISFLINSAYFLKWNREKSHTVYNISRELGKKLDNAFIAGLTAPVAVLENRHRSLFLYPGFVNWSRDTFQRYPITHALLASFNQEITNFFQQWPEKMNQARLLRVYNVKDQFLHLYSFVDPVIKEVHRMAPDHFRLSIANPRNNPVKIRAGVIWFFRDPGSVDQAADVFHREEPRRSFVLEPGENTVELKTGQQENPRPVSGLFFLDLEEWPDSYRYEAEKFPKKVGINRWNPEASAKFTRTFYQKRHPAGFLSFGPFIPYSDGFMEVRFYFKPSHIRSRIKPVIKLDMFSYREKKALRSRILKPADLTDNIFRPYTLSAAISGVRYLEFRVYAERLSDIDLDYIDVVYYQGYWFKISEKDEEAPLLSQDSR
jgi:hypothetical protein